MSILFNGKEPIESNEFLERLKAKVSSWDDFAVPLRGDHGRLSPLEAIWNVNCKALNNAINDNKKNIVMKYVISAPTGSAKTESLITYCSMLPDKYTVLIATNLTDEADKIAHQINQEANKAYDDLYALAKDIHPNLITKNPNLQRAYSYHKKKSKAQKLDIEDVANFQIVVTTHEFYKRNFAGSDIWTQLGESRDLLVIDEALETMQEYLVKDASIGRAIRIFEDIKKSNKFKNDLTFERELQSLRYELRLLESSEDGTKLLYPDTTTAHGLNLTLYDAVDKYKLFSEILGQIHTEDKTIKNFIKNTNLNYTLTGQDDRSNQDDLRKELNNTINSLNLMSKIGQVYITSHKGHKSFHRVTDMMFHKSLVCFDATTEVNDVYKLREKYYDDIHLIKKHPGVRDYASVVLHSAVYRTSEEAIDNDLIATVLNNVKFGEKTLIVTHKKRTELFKSQILALYPDEIIDVAHWGAITGLNNWNDFDTCIIVGLLHKPRSYSQNRVIINTDSEERAFGDEQDSLNNSIEHSVILAEAIQAMNRIRIRKIINSAGACQPANIYILLPKNQEVIYKNQIAGQMPNIQFREWDAEFTEAKPVPANFTILVNFLHNWLKTGASILKKDLVKELGMSTNSFGTLQGKTPAKKQEFKENLRKAGIGIREVMAKGGTIPRQYFYKIEQD